MRLKPALAVVPGGDAQPAHPSAVRTLGAWESHRTSADSAFNVILSGGGVAAVVEGSPSALAADGAAAPCYPWESFGSGALRLRLG